MEFGNWAEILTSDAEVIEAQGKAYYVYFYELSNFVGGTFFVRPLIFEIIEG